MMNTSLTVRNDHEEVIGHIRNWGCVNDHCHAAYVNGMKWHAIPSGMGDVLPEYHFRSADDAIQALHEVANR